MARKVVGLDTLKRQLAALPQLQLQAAHEALGGGSSELAEKIASACAVPQIAEHVEAKEGSPKSTNAEARELRETAGLSFYVQADTSTDGTHVFNPVWEEYGTKPHSVAKGADRASGKYQDKGPHSPGAHARPFFWPTVRAWKRLMRARMNRSTNKAAKAAAAIR